MNDLVSRYAIAIALLPAAGIASAICVVLFDHAIGVIYFPVFWIGFSAATELIRDPSRGSLMNKIAFWLFFPAGVGLLLVALALNLWSGQ
jgi:hypothetical protein